MGSNLPKRNRTDQTTAELTLIAGLLQNAAAIPSIVIDGALRTNKDIVAVLQDRVEAARAVESTRASWLAAVQAERDQHAKTARYVSGIRQALLVAFGERVDTLAAFGLTRRAQHVRTPEEKLAATAKAQATRAARHTMGPKQKAAIRGTVDAAESPPPSAAEDA